MGTFDMTFGIGLPSRRSLWVKVEWHEPWEWSWGWDEEWDYSYLIDLGPVHITYNPKYMEVYVSED